MRRSSRRRVGAAILGVLCAALALASPVPFWGARESDPAGTDPAALRPGHFIWDASIAPDGPIVMVVSLSEQRADVYRNGVRVGVTTVSTGRPGHITPTGVFTILNKDKDHRSRTYDDAPMPYSERLTWDGVALHAGGLPGFPESHGCVHLPTRFAQLLFGVTHVGMTVVIASDRTAPHEVSHPAFLAPVAMASGTPVPEEGLAAGQGSRWHPEISPDGPITIVVSGADRRILVFRSGIEIGRARITIENPETPLGTEAFVRKSAAVAPLAASSASSAAPLPVTPVPSATPAAGPSQRWMAIPLPGSREDSAAEPDPQRIHVPPGFVKELSGVLAVGTTLYVTDAPVLEETTGKALNVVNSDPPSEAAAP
jgi:hypothetical protein